MVQFSLAKVDGCPMGAVVLAVALPNFQNLDSLAVAIILRYST